MVQFQIKIFKRFLMQTICVASKSFFICPFKVQYSSFKVPHQWCVQLFRILIGAINPRNLLSPLFISVDSLLKIKIIKTKKKHYLETKKIAYQNKCINIVTYMEIRHCVVTDDRTRWGQICLGPSYSQWKRDRVVIGAKPAHTTI